MAIIVLNKTEIQKITGKSNDEKLDEILSLFGAVVESISGNEVAAEIAPNRPDMLSQQGFLRALRSYTGKKAGLASYKINIPEKDYLVDVEKSVLDVRPYTACAIIKGLNLTDEKIKEIIDIQEKLHNTIGRNRKKIAIGIYPLEKIKLPVKFKALPPNNIKFVPLEAHAEMTGKQILSQHPTGKEYAHLLENAELFPVFTDSAGEILSMPPIINSHKTGKITEATKEVFIECSGFNLDVLRKTLNILSVMFADMGGKIYQMKIKHKKGDYITPDFNPEKMKISLDNANKLLGLNLSEKDMRKCLEKMGYNYKKGEVEIPAWRTDILHENDLIEDVAIAYGYNNFEPEIPNIYSIGQESEIESKKRKIAYLLSGLNFLEVSNYHLTTLNDQFKKLGIKKDKIIEVKESKTEYSLLRSNLIHCLLRNLNYNVDSEYPQRIFELGVVFEKSDKEKTKLKEKEKLCIAASESDANFTKIKQIFDYLMNSLGKEYKIQKGENSLFIDGRCASVIINGKEAGYFGEIKPQILNNLKIKMPVSALEIDISFLL